MAENAQKTLKIAFTGGGSGGHLSAATAVIQKLKELHPEIVEHMVYIGGMRGMINDPTPSIESRKVPELGVRFVGIRSGKLHRKFNFYTLKLLLGVWGGFWDAYKVLGQEKPGLLFSTGGYVTVPLVIAAWLRRIPIVIHEQTIVSGLANRISSKFAQKVLVTFPNSVADFPKSKTVVVGNAIQESRFKKELPDGIAEDYKNILLRFAGEARQEGGRSFIFFTGGGLGSHTLNAWILNNLENLTDNYNILVQTGENKLHNDFDVLAGAVAKLSSEKKTRVHVVKWFSAEIGFIYANVNAVVARPGANTVLELLATNTRGVFIPIPWSSNNEQLLNAQYFAAHQAGKIVAQKDIEAQLMLAISEVLKLQLQDSASHVNRDAAEKIIKILLSF